MRSNPPFTRDRFLELAWRTKQDPAPIPPSFKVRDSQKVRTICHLRTWVGQGNETLLEGGLFDTISGVSRRRTAKCFEGFLGRLALGSAYPLIGTANSRQRGELKRRRPTSSLREFDHFFLPPAGGPPDRSSRNLRRFLAAAVSFASTP